jgi:hypothetical protein
MRRGIATFQLLAHLAPAALLIGLLAGYVAWRPLTPICDSETAPPAPAFAGGAPVLELPSGTLRNGTLHAPNGLSLDAMGASLTYVKITGDLTHADLSYAQLGECGFQRASLTGIKLRGATYDRFTRWPAGSDPQAHGARLME